jgi:hypothetical protein
MGEWWMVAKSISTRDRVVDRQEERKEEKIDPKSKNTLK